ncbi:hypothetical protein M8J75_013545 [Diaphorina citri]|jgi:hypothetical protein|nr:hypothetical protein M8J75_013545 [Diaphorina citri]
MDEQTENASLLKETLPAETPETLGVPGPEVNQQDVQDDEIDEKSDIKSIDAKDIDSVSSIVSDDVPSSDECVDDDINSDSDVEQDEDKYKNKKYDKVLESLLTFWFIKDETQSGLEDKDGHSEEQRENASDLLSTKPKEEKKPDEEFSDEDVGGDEEYYEEKFKEKLELINNIREKNKLLSAENEGLWDYYKKQKEDWKNPTEESIQDESTKIQSLKDKLNLIQEDEKKNDIDKDWKTKEENEMAKELVNTQNEYKRLELQIKEFEAKFSPLTIEHVERLRQERNVRIAKLQQEIAEAKEKQRHTIKTSPKSKKTKTPKSSYAKTKKQHEPLESDEMKVIKLENANLEETRDEIKKRCMNLIRDNEDMKHRIKCLQGKKKQIGKNIKEKYDIILASEKIIELLRNKFSKMKQQYVNFIQVKNATLSTVEECAKLKTDLSKVRNEKQELEADVTIQKKLTAHITEETKSLQRECNDLQNFLRKAVDVLTDSLEIQSSSIDLEIKKSKRRDLLKILLQMLNHGTEERFMRISTYENFAFDIVRFLKE